MSFEALMYSAPPPSTHGLLTSAESHSGGSCFANHLLKQMLHKLTFGMGTERFNADDLHLETVSVATPGNICFLTLMMIILLINVNLGSKWTKTEHGALGPHVPSSLFLFTSALDGRRLFWLSTTPISLTAGLGGACQSEQTSPAGRLIRHICTFFF